MQSESWQHLDPEIACDNREDPIDMVVEQILEGYDGWDAEAQQDAQCEQDHRAYDGTMRMHLRDAIEPLTDWNHRVEELRDIGIRMAGYLTVLCTTGDGSEPTERQQRGMALVHEFKKAAGIQ